MIYSLKDVPNANPDLIGQELSVLSNLLTNEISVIDTLVLTAEMFDFYARNGAIDSIHIKQIMKALKRRMFSNSPHIFLQISTGKKCLGIYKDIKVEKDYTAIKFAIEKVYRSWFDEAARAYRIIHSISENNSIPSVFIQPYSERIFSLVTRTPTSGLRTDKTNYNLNVHNTVHSFVPAHEKLLEKAENVIQKPSKIYFTGDSPLRVCKVKNQIMTDTAYWSVLGEYHRKGWLDKIEYIMRIQPYMLSQHTGYEFISNDASTVTVAGLGASPGITIGKLIFRTSDVRKIESEKMILAVSNSSPEDVRRLRECAGAIETNGYLTGHLAMVCRGWSIPAVVATPNFVINESKRQALYFSETITEFTDIVLDGNTGRIAFSDKGVFRNKYKFNDTARAYISDVCTILSSFDNIEIFKQLPLHVQKHIATLKLHLRRVGFLK